MKASELISSLIELIAKHGDLEVFAFDLDRHTEPIVEISITPKNCSENMFLIES